MPDSSSGNPSGDVCCTSRSPKGTRCSLPPGHVDRGVRFHRAASEYWSDEGEYSYPGYANSDDIYGSKPCSVYCGAHYEGPGLQARSAPCHLPPGHSVWHRSSNFTWPVSEEVNDINNEQTQGSYGFALKNLAEGLGEAMRLEFLSPKEAETEFRAHVRTLQVKAKREAEAKLLRERAGALVEEAGRLETSDGSPSYQADRDQYA